MSGRQRSADPDAALSNRIRQTFEVWGQGILKSEIIGDGLRAALTPKVMDFCRQHFQSIKSWSYISSLWFLVVALDKRKALARFGRVLLVPTEREHALTNDDLEAAMCTHRA